MDGFTLTNILMTLYLVGIIVGLFIIFKTVLNHKIEKKKTEIPNNSQCKKVLRDHWWKLHTDYFWSNHMRFAWIMLFLLFFKIF